MKVVPAMPLYASAYLPSEWTIIVGFGLMGPSAFMIRFQGQLRPHTFQRVHSVRAASQSTLLPRFLPKFSLISTTISCKNWAMKRAAFPPSCTYPSWHCYAGIIIEQLAPSCRLCANGSFSVMDRCGIIAESDVFSTTHSVQSSSSIDFRSHQICFSPGNRSFFLKNAW